uniref:Uncharacterized protein n=1 Tax=Timema monikensis TaxID=170555 RepID=A0A7R9ENW2_9NEOP|nr:unnamed protein product [Timema monikensis]
MCWRPMSLESMPSQDLEGSSTAAGRAALGGNGASTPG